jgi:RNA polymerase primary sigma factor
MRQLKISASITSREYLSVNKYLQEINKMDLISGDEEFRLASLISKGDKQAKDALIKANLRFVVSVAKQFQGQGLSLPDLINEGNIGLVRAAERFDATRGFKFVSFAVWHVRQQMLQAINEQSRLVRLPQNKTVMTRSIRNAQNKLEQELGRSASTEEIAGHLGIDTTDVDEAIGWHADHVSLDAPFTSEDETSLLDTTADENAELSDKKMDHRESLRAELHRSMQTLDKRQQQMLCYFFGIGVDHPLSLDEIARRYDLTPERVRQIKEKAITKLRSNKNAELLKPYLNA